VFHLSHLHGVSEVEAVTLTTGLWALVVLPAVLIGVAVVQMRRRRDVATGVTSERPIR
jgi:hypothetical protein